MFFAHKKVSFLVDLKKNDFPCDFVNENQARSIGKWKMVRGDHINENGFEVLEDHHEHFCPC